MVIYFSFWLNNVLAHLSCGREDGLRYRSTQRTDPSLSCNIIILVQFEFDVAWVVGNVSEPSGAGLTDLVQMQVGESGWRGG